MTPYNPAQPRVRPRVGAGRRRFDIVTIGLHWATVTTHSYPDSRTLSTKPASMAGINGWVRIEHEVTFLCRNRHPPDEIPGLTQMRLHRQQIENSRR